MFKIEGTLKMKTETFQISEKFSKRDFVITIDGMYPQDIQFQLTQDKCMLIDSIGVNQKIEVSFNLRGREWTSPSGEIRYFNTLDAWRVSLLNTTTAAPAQHTTATSPVATPNAPASDDDDLPF